MRDSLVTSSIWKPEFKQPLETFPIFRLGQLEFSIPICDACHLGNRVATLSGILSGYAYDSLTYEVFLHFLILSQPEYLLYTPTIQPRHHDESEDAGDIAAEWNLGRFCAARAQVL